MLYRRLALRATRIWLAPQGLGDGCVQLALGGRRRQRLVAVGGEGRGRGGRERGTARGRWRTHVEDREGLEELALALVFVVVFVVFVVVFA